MDGIDLKIMELLKGNARMSYQELGNQIGMSRVAAKKRVQKLEEEGVIRGYNTCIYRDDEITMFIDIVTEPDKYEEVLKYISTRTAYIRQIFRTTKENHIHMVAVSDSAQNLAYLIRMIRKKCGDDIVELHCHAVKEVITFWHCSIYCGASTIRKLKKEWIAANLWFRVVILYDYKRSKQAFHLQAFEQRRNCLPCDRREIYDQ